MIRRVRRSRIRERVRETSVLWQRNASRNVKTSSRLNMEDTVRAKRENKIQLKQ